MRWTRTIQFPQGRFRFRATVDDGVRLYIDGGIVIDQWKDEARSTYSVDRDLGAGNHTIVMEYYERNGEASARLELRQVLTNRVGNIITCVPPQPPNYAWIKLYRLNGANQWVTLGRGIGSINPTGFLKIDGLPVDVARFGGAGEPYKVEQWVDSRIVQSTGDFQRGEAEFRVRAFADNSTPWSCNL